MTQRHRIFGNAAQIVHDGWAQRAFETPDGKQCLIQSVATSAELEGTMLPPELLYPIDDYLKRYPMYRFIRRSMLDMVTVHRDFNQLHPMVAKFFTAIDIPTTVEDALSSAIMMWNDIPGRRKETVVDVLNKVSEDLELKWLRAEHSRLVREVEELRSRVITLENENGRLKRLTNSFALRSDRKELDRLDKELDAAWDDLTEAQSVRIS